MKNPTRTSTASPTPSLIALRDDEVSPASGAGLYAEVQNFLHGLVDGYRDHDKDQNIVYGGMDGNDPPNA